MSARPKKHSLPRRLFRWCRITLLLVVLAFSLVLLWCNYVRVPEFIARPVRDELRKNNVALEFDRLRLSGFRRIIAEDLRIQPLSSTNTVRARVAEGVLIFGFTRELAHPFAVRGIRVDGGEIGLAIHAPGTAERNLTATNLHAQIDFLPGDRLRIATLGGEAFGARADVSGTVRNFSQLRFSEGNEGKPGQDWQRELAEVESIAQQLTFAAPPELTIRFTADATNLPGSRATVTLRADQGSSRRGSFRRLRVSSAVYPLTNEPAVKASFAFALQDFRSASAQFSSVNLAAESQWSGDMQTLQTNHIELNVDGLQMMGITSPRLEATLSSAQQKEKIASRFTAHAPAVKAADAELADVSLGADVEHPLPFAAPAQLLSRALSSKPPRGPRPEAQTVSGEWRVETAVVKTPRLQIEGVTFSGDLSTVPTEAGADPALGLWEYLRAFDIPWQMHLRNFSAGQATLGNVSARGRWTFPELSVTEAEMTLYDGRLSARGALDVQTRRVSASSDSIFDYHEAGVLLDPPAQRALDQFGWETPPSIQTEITLTLPPWTNSWASFWPQAGPSLAVVGNFSWRGSFRGAPLGLTESSFSFSNYVWRLPDLRITRPEGRASIDCSGNVTNQQVAARIVSQIDPAILAPAFDEKAERAFSFAHFPNPPRIEAEVQANLNDLQSVTARGSVTATNFFIKEQAFTFLRTTFYYTNLLIELSGTKVTRGKEQLDAPWLKIDFPGEVMFVTNAVSTIDPYIAMSFVGPETYSAIDPYRFANSPTVHVNGFVPLRHYSKADLHFQVAGTDFSFWKFHLPALSGDVFWKSDKLNLSNVHAAFYNGKADWSAHFDIEHKTDNAHFSFRAHATDASLQPLVRDLFGTTNRLEGTFNADLIITSADTENIQSWNGHGKATLKDGYLWSIPIFGIFSPALDSIAPGMGSNPVSSGGGSFTITNSVIYTRDLQVRAPAFRLNYKGNVDMDGKLDARVDAELLRDAWVVGKLFSTALWPVSKVFEANVTGVLNNPKTTFRFVPKFLTAPLRAISAITDAARKKEEKNKPAPAGEAPPNPAAPLQ